MYLKPSRLSIYNRTHDYEVCLIGVGGTGSRVAHHLGSLNFALLNSDKPGIRLTMIDMDKVEYKNIGRQKFRPHHIGMFKTDAVAQDLARDYLMKNITLINKPIQEVDKNVIGKFDLIILCVDNVEARSFIYDNVKHIHIIDTGNEKDYGQVILSKDQELKNTFEIFGYDNFVQQTEESDYQCDNYARQFEKQSLFINETISLYTAQMIQEFLVEETIDYNCVFINLKNKRTSKTLKTWH